MSSSPRRRYALSTQLVAWLLLILTIALTLFSLVTMSLTRNDLMRRFDDSVREASQRSFTFVNGRGDRSPGEAPQTVGVMTVVLVDGSLDEQHSVYHLADGTNVALTSDDLAELKRHGLLETSPTAASHSTAGPPGSVSTELVTLELSQGKYRVIGQRFTAPRSEQHTVVVIGSPLQPVETTMARLGTTLFIGSLLTLLAAGIVVFLVVRRSLRPLARISDVAAEVAALPLSSESALEQRVAAELCKPGTEVGNVGNGLNSLLDNVAAAFAARDKSEATLRGFVADASHELRTPLAAVRGYTDVVKMTEKLSPDGEQALSRIESQAKRMGGLVEDLLQLARLDAHRPVPVTRLDLTERVLEAVADAQAAAPDHTWRVEVAPDPVEVTGNAEQLDRILTNLLSNAWKHTPAGTSVIVRLGMRVNQAVLTVTDNGPGIPETFQPRLFDRFARADGARVAKEGSTGLGLAIVKAIVESMQGTIGLDSEPGRTQFTITLPVAS